MNDAGHDRLGVDAVEDEDQRERDEADRLADERDHRGRVLAARLAAEEVRGAPQQRREERRADHVLAAAAAALYAASSRRIRSGLVPAASTSS